eukprot:COSAG01_NODE_8918_length_2614_cov_1.600398_4_plen_219_part_00
MSAFMLASAEQEVGTAGQTQHAPRRVVSVDATEAATASASSAAKFINAFFKAHPDVDKARWINYTLGGQGGATRKTATAFLEGHADIFELTPVNECGLSRIALTTRGRQLGESSQPWREQGHGGAEYVAAEIEGDDPSADGRWQRVGGSGGSSGGGADAARLRRMRRLCAPHGAHRCAGVSTLYAAVLTGICLHAACSCHGIREWTRPGQGAMGGVLG